MPDREPSPESRREMGYQPVLAAAAWARLDAGKANADGLFPDVVMPGMSGVGPGQEIQRRYPAVPVILTHGYRSVLDEGGTQRFELLHQPYPVDEPAHARRRVSDRTAA